MKFRHTHILIFFATLGVFLVPVGNIMTIQGRFAKGDDSSIYLVDFDESDYDLYIKGYYPSDYTYDDFRRDSIEGMVSHYVATDNNNFSSVVDTIEQDVLQNGWSVIDNFFENAWIDLKSGVLTVAQGFTDDFKHTLDNRFKSASTSGGPVTIDGHQFYASPLRFYRDGTFYSGVGVNGAPTLLNSGAQAFSYATVYTTNVNGSYPLFVVSTSGASYFNVPNYNISTGRESGATWDTARWYSASKSGYYTTGGRSPYGDWGFDVQFTSVADACSVFFGGGSIVTELHWNGDGYYSNIPSDFSINLPALPSIDWQSISNNNKTKYGVDFPDFNLTVDFQLPDSYYPQTVTYDTPYWLYNTDSTPVDWANVSFDDVTLPEVQLSDGDGSFFQALFNTLPLAFVPILLGVILCYLIFLML